MASDVEDRVGNFAFYSRILVMLTQVFFNNLMPDHDAKVFNPPVLHQSNRLDRWVEFLCEGFRRWDGVYFMHISEHGYTYENTLAFFPGFPLLVRLLANSVFFPLQYIMNYFSVLLLSATILNFLLFIWTARILLRLGKKVLCDETLAFKAAQLFCVNPASIFFSACYSEVLFAFVTFSGMLQLESNQNTKASFLFGLSGFVRSNGMTNIGYILYKKSQEFLNKVADIQKTKCSDLKSLVISLLKLIWHTLTQTLFYVTICSLPFVLYQVYSYWIFCNPRASTADLNSHIVNYGNENKYKMAHTGLSEWCFHKVPLSYSYIQQHHWDIGFLAYYEYKQIPNFLLALPMTLLCLGVTVHYARRNLLHLLSLGLTSESFYKKYDEDPHESVEYGLSSKRCLVYVVHIAFLATFGLLFMHVQVITRMIASASPIIYWYVATLTTPREQLEPKVMQHQNVARANAHFNMERQANGDKAVTHTVTEDAMDWESGGCTHKMIFIYFLLYFFVGIAAFSNFLPWT